MPTTRDDTVREVLLAQVDELLNPRASSAEETSGFRSVSHEAMCEAVRKWIEDAADILAEPPQVRITQGLQDSGADVIAEFSRAHVKIGIQVKSHRDLSQSAFTRECKAQIAESAEHGLDRLYVILCGDHADSSQLGKIRWWQSFISKRTDQYVRCVPGTTAWTICSQEGPDVDVLGPRLDRLRSEIEAITDAARLRARTHEELRSIAYGIECGEDTLIHIERVSVQEIVAAARQGHAVVHGEPGVGKSWVLRQAAERLAEDDEAQQQALLLRVERMPAESLTQLRNELGLDRDVPEVLSAMAVDGVNVLFIDGLDAARSPARARVMRELIGAVIEQTDWHVVVSIRSFDWEYSIHFRDVLAVNGASPPAIEVGPLDDCDLLRVTEQAPQLAGLILEDTALRELVPNPFNLELLAGVATAYAMRDQDVSALRAIGTQVELLREYWRHRVNVGDLGNAREAVVRDAAQQMLSAGELRVRVAELHPQANEINELLSDGVFVRLDVGGLRLGFFHNVFADFAAAQALGGDVSDVLTLMLDDERALFLRPAMRMLLAYAYHWGRNDFWELFHAISENEDLRALWRIMPAQVLVEAAPDSEDLDPLVTHLCSATEEADPYGLRAVLIAIHHLPRPTRDGDLDDRWLRFCHCVRDAVSPEATGLYTKYLTAWSEVQSLTTSQAEWLNDCARSVYSRSAERAEQLGHAGAIAVGVIANTFQATPVESRSILGQVAEGLDYDACWHLALGINHIIPHDPEFAAEIMQRFFAHRETSQEQVPMGHSLVMSFTMRRADQWGSVWLQLEEALPGLLTRSPRHGVEVVCSVTDALMQERADSFDRTLPEPQRLRGAGVEFQFRVDFSSIWYHGTEHREGREAVVGKFDEWLGEAAAAAPDEAARILDDLVPALRARNTWAVIWAICLEQAAAHPHTMSPCVLPLLACPDVLRSSDTRYQAGEAIRSCYPEYSASDQASVVDAVLRIPDIPDATDEQAEVYRGTRDVLLRCVPERPTDATAASMWEELAGRTDIENRRPYVTTIQHGEVTDEIFLRDVGVDTQAPEYQQLEVFVSPVRDFVDATRNQVPSWEDCVESFPHMRELGDYLLSHESQRADPAHHEMARTCLSQATAHVTLCRELPKDQEMVAWVRDWLLRFSRDPSPEPDPARAASFDQAPSWSPAPRTEAAQGLLRLAWLQDAEDEEVLGGVQRLADDDCPQVRLQIACDLRLLAASAPEVMWELCEAITEEDESPGVLLFLINKTLSRLARSDTDRVVDLLSSVHHRSASLPQSMPLMKELAEHLACTGTYLGHPRAQRMRASWLDDGGVPPEALAATVHPLRDALLFDDEQDPDRANRVRADAIQWYSDLTAYAQAQLRQRDAQFRSQPTQENTELIEEGRKYLRLLDSVTSNVSFAVKGRSRGEDEGEPSPEAVARFFHEATDLLQTLAGLGHPALVHDVLRTLNSALPCLPAADIEQFIALLEATCGGRGGIDLRHFESLIVSEVVKIVRTLLADHRDLLSRSQEARTALLGILDAFVSVGWPEPHELVFHLEEVAR